MRVPSTNDRCFAAEAREDSVEIRDLTGEPEVELGMSRHALTV